MNMEPPADATPGTPPRYYSIQQVADALGVEHKTVRRAVNSGDLGAVRFRGVIRISDDALNAYLAGRTVAPGSVAC